MINIFEYLINKTTKETNTLTEPCLLIKCWKQPKYVSTNKFDYYLYPYIAYADSDNKTGVDKIKVKYEDMIDTFEYDHDGVYTLYKTMRIGNEDRVYTYYVYLRETALALLRTRQYSREFKLYHYKWSEPKSIWGRIVKRWIKLFEDETDK